RAGLIAESMKPVQCQQCLTALLNYSFDYYPAMDAFIFPESMAHDRRYTIGVSTSLFARCPRQLYSPAFVRAPGSMPGWGCSMDFLRRIARSPRHGIQRSVCALSR